ncbi:hypothetical protein LX36DRAFT_413595 [Colletotrichum falcatum]|nr:hypothetical protein LX36DRAFT_413595 [Colletotrichum falcatum]
MSSSLKPMGGFSGEAGTAKCNNSGVRCNAVRQLHLNSEERGVGGEERRGEERRDMHLEFPIARGPPKTGPTHGPTVRSSLRRARIPGGWTWFLADSTVTQPKPCCPSRSMPIAISRRVRHSPPPSSPFSTEPVSLVRCRSRECKAGDCARLVATRAFSSSSSWMGPRAVPDSIAGPKWMIAHATPRETTMGAAWSSPRRGSQPAGRMHEEGRP